MESTTPTQPSRLLSLWVYNCNVELCHVVVSRLTKSMEALHQLHRPTRLLLHTIQTRKKEEKGNATDGRSGKLWRRCFDRSGPADPQQAPILPPLRFPATVSVSCKSHRLVYIISILSLRPGIWLFDWLPSWIILLESDLQYPNKMLSRWNFSSAKQSKTHFLSNAFFHTIYLPTSLPVSPVGKKEESFFIFGQPWSCDPPCPSLGCISLPKRRRRCRCGPDGQPQRITVNPSCRLDPAAARKKHRSAPLTCSCCSAARSLEPLCGESF